MRSRRKKVGWGHFNRILGRGRKTKSDPIGVPATGPLATIRDEKIMRRKKRMPVSKNFTFFYAKKRPFEAILGPPFSGPKAQKKTPKILGRGRKTHYARKTRSDPPGGGGFPVTGPSATIPNAAGVASAKFRRRFRRSQRNRAKGRVNKNRKK